MQNTPDFATGLSSGKVKDRNVAKPRPVKIRKAVYSEIRELWEAINQRYLLFYDDDLDADMAKLFIFDWKNPVFLQTLS